MIMYARKMIRVRRCAFLPAYRSNAYPSVRPDGISGSARWGVDARTARGRAG
jgi:hypothetical protein